MIPRQKDIDAQNRQMDELAERWEMRIHAVALALTAVILTMRLVTGRQDLTSDDTRWSGPSSEASAATPADAEPSSVAGAPEPLANGDRGSSADTSPTPERAAHVGVPESLSAR